MLEVGKKYSFQTSSGEVTGVVQSFTEFPKGGGEYRQITNILVGDKTVHVVLDNVDSWYEVAA